MLLINTQCKQSITQHMARVRHFILFVLMVTIPSLGLAAQYEVSSKDELQAQYQLLLELKAENAVSENVFTEKSTFLHQQAQTNFHFDLDSGTYTSDIPIGNAHQISKQPSPISDTEQRIDSFTTALYAISALLLLALIGKVMSHFPPLLNELLIYGASIISLIFFHYEYWLLVAGFSLGSIVSYSVLSRISDDKEEAKWVGWPLAITFAALALIFDNSIFGFCSVLALLSTFGFMILVAPGRVTVGSQDERVAQSVYLTALSFTLTLLAWLVFYTDWFAPLLELRQPLQSFELGMLTLLPLAYFSGISQLSFFLLKEKPWLRFSAELIGLISEIAVVTIALLYKLDTMFWIAALFLMWNFLDKFYRLIYKHVSYVSACTLFALFFAGISALIKSNIDVIMPYLEFLGL